MQDLEEAPPAAIVRHIVRRIPAGRAASYGTVGRVASALARPIGGARTVAWILASLKGKDETPWHRVLGAGGRILLPDRRGALQASRLRQEGVRFARSAMEPRFLIGEEELLSVLLGRRRAARKN